MLAILHASHIVQIRAASATWLIAGYAFIGGRETAPTAEDFGQVADAVDSDRKLAAVMNYR